jgi:hypothetical protein
MPPRPARVAGVPERDREARSAHVVAAAQHAAPAIAALPLALVRHILSLLPVDCRLLCAGVCRSWRAALEDTSLWLRLDLSASGVSPVCVVTDKLLRAAAARAGGQLQSLDVSDCTRLASDAVVAVATANAGTLRELHMIGVGWRRTLLAFALEKLLRAAPRLAVCEADVLCREVAMARRLLRNEPPFAPLRLRTFAFDCEQAQNLDEAAVVALAADAASQVHLRRLKLSHTPLDTAAALDSVVDAALTRRLTSVTLQECYLSPASVPALVRLIGGGALAELHTRGSHVWQHNVLLDVPAAVALGNALRASSTLTALSLRASNLWREPAAATALFGALTGHSRLRSLNVSGNQVDEASRDRAGAWIAALLAANAPALLELDVGGCSLLDTGLRPLLEALPANTHLRSLACSGNWLTDDFTRDALLPAVRASSSLRELKTGLECKAACEAETLVQGRAADEAFRANPSRGSERAARAEQSRFRANQQAQRSALKSSEMLFAALARLRT